MRPPPFPSGMPARCYRLALALCLLPACGGSDEPGMLSCYQEAPISTLSLCERFPVACPVAEGSLPGLSEAVTVVPDAAAMPAGVVSQKAHNNLDIAYHQGRLFFAFRTAPNHFANAQVSLYVVSTTDLQKWQLETHISLGKDLREPRFLTLGDRLLLYFARLGEITFTFQPEAMMLTEQLTGCRWSEPEEVSPVGQAGIIPWRAREIDGQGYLMAYVGGEEIYELDGEGVQVHFLSTEDGRQFEPVVPGKSVVLHGGSSETDWAFLADGSLVAVSRNESGDELGWGSKICRADAASLGDWTCQADPKKYDSPLLFTHDDAVYLVGRRQVANEGNYDLGYDELSHAEQTAKYQAAYWSTPKRCALWQVDPEALSVNFLLDLPSNGDTCFASVLPLSDSQYLLFNYSSPLSDPDLPWSEGQFGETSIYRTTLSFP